MHNFVHVGEEAGGAQWDDDREDHEVAGKRCSSEEVLTTTIMLGVQKVMIRVEKESEGIKIQSIDSTHEIENAFCKFRNIMSGPPTDIYGKFYGRDT